MKKVGILGVSGYVARELIRILLNHPDCRIEHLVSESSTNGKDIAGIFPAFRKLLSQKTTDEPEALYECDIVLTSKPDTDSQKWVPRFIKNGCRVIDMSAAYRFRDAKIYEATYEREHKSKELLKDAVYGLTEIYRDKVKDARLVANPGCYPISVILGSAPLMKYGLVDAEDIVVDAYSGTTGAGINPEAFSQYLFSELDENMKPYKVCEHKHAPEMEQELGLLAGQKAMVTFVPHLAPLRQGILSSIYFKLLKPGISASDLRKLYVDFYKKEFFVRVMDVGEAPAIQHVEGTNFCDIGVFADKKSSRVVVISAIDNLIKGAAGQAIQNLNVMLGFEETTALVSLNAVGLPALTREAGVEQFIRLPIDQR